MPGVNLCRINTFKFDVFPPRYLTSLKVLAPIYLFGRLTNKEFYSKGTLAKEFVRRTKVNSSVQFALDCLTLNSKKLSNDFVLLDHNVRGQNTKLRDILLIYSGCDYHVTIFTKTALNPGINSIIAK